MSGGSNRDLLNGGSGDDILSGDGGKDTLLGGTGNDSLNGGPGADILEGQAGNDTLTGDAGANTFVFNASNSLKSGFKDIITDFNPNTNFLEFVGFGFAGSESDFANMLELNNQIMVDTFTDTVTILGTGTGIFKPNYFGMNGSITIQSTDSVTSATDVLNAGTLIFV